MGLYACFYRNLKAGNWAEKAEEAEEAVEEFNLPPLPLLPPPPPFTTAFHCILSFYCHEIILLPGDHLPNCLHCFLQS